MSCFDVTNRRWDRLQLDVVRLSQNGLLQFEDIVAETLFSEWLVRSMMDAITEPRHSDVERCGEGQWELTMPTVVVDEDKTVL